jgi:hypothetical protein
MFASSRLCSRLWKKTNRKPRHFLLQLEELEARTTPSASPLDAAFASLNWSGYAVETNLNTPGSGAVNEVHGKWHVPAVTGKIGSYSSFWVGIDGFSSSTVEQIGTDSDMSSGVPQYYAWFEMYPQASKFISTLVVNAGDAIAASVTYNGNDKFTLQINNETTGGTFSIVQSLPGAARSSAEWIAEAPSSFSGILPLANFGSVTFTNAGATLSTTTGPIDSSSWQDASIDMVSRSGAVIAKTGPLTDTTDSKGNITSSFSVAFQGTTLTGGGHKHGTSHTAGTIQPEAPLAFVQNSQGAPIIVVVPVTAVSETGTASFLFTQPTSYAVPPAVNNTLVTTYASYYTDAVPTPATANEQEMPPKNEAPNQGDPCQSATVSYSGTTPASNATVTPANATRLDRYFSETVNTEENGSAEASVAPKGAIDFGAEVETDFLSGAELAALMIGGFMLFPVQEVKPDRQRRSNWLR